MNCSEICEKLLSYTNGELCGPEKAELEAHVEECTVCRARLEALQAAESCIRESLREPVESPDLADSVMALLPKQEGPVVRKWVWAWAVAAGLVVVIGVRLFVWTGGEHEPRQPGDMTPTKIVETPAPPDETVARSPEPPVVGKAAAKPKRADSVRPKRISKLDKKRRERRQKEPDQAYPAAKAAAPSPVMVVIERKAEPSDGPERRSLVTATMVLGERTITTTRETVIIPLRPDEDAAFIDRPPLKVVSIPRRGVEPGG